MHLNLSLADLPALTEIQAEKARRHLRNYVKYAWPIIEPGTEYMHNWHIDAICEHLEYVTSGEIKRLLINMPPRYMKSICVSVMWPTWEWIDHSQNRYIFASYSQSLSTKHSVDRRTIIQSDWYQNCFGHCFELSGDQNQKTEFQNTKRGVMVATSFGGSATGKGGSRIVIDDPHNPKEAESEKERESGIQDYKLTFSTRLDNKKEDAIIVIMQRLNVADLSGYVLDEEGDDFVHLFLPAECKGKRTLVLPSGKILERDDRIVKLPSGNLIERKEGDLLWPDREGRKEIDAMKRTLGTYGFAGQYDQMPSPGEGGILKRKWWRFWHYPDHSLPPVQIYTEDGPVELPVRPLPTLDMQLQSWDCSFKDEKSSDFVVGQDWGKHKADAFLMDQIRDKLDLPSTVAAVRKMTAKHPQAMTKLVEDKANGTAVIQTLRHEIPGLIEVNPMGGKVARANAVSPMIESGNVYLPHPAIAPWIWDFIEECAAFPNSPNDDQVDAMSQALARMGFNNDVQEFSNKNFAWYKGAEIVYDDEKGWLFRGESITVVVGVAPAVDDSDTPVDASITIVGITKDSDVIVIENRHGQWPFAKQAKEIKEAYDDYVPEMVGIEVKAYKALRQHIQTDDVIPVRSLNHTGDKHLRLIRISPLHDAGKIYLREAVDDEPGQADPMGQITRTIHQDCYDLFVEMVQYPGGLSSSLIDSLECAISISNARKFFAMKDKEKSVSIAEENINEIE